MAEKGLAFLGWRTTQSRSNRQPEMRPGAPSASFPAINRAEQTVSTLEPPGHAKGPAEASGGKGVRVGGTATLKGG